jgi:hypothetical protein
MALAFAARTPEVDDDIQAIQLLIQLPSGVLAERDVVASANQLLEIVQEGQRHPNIIPCIGEVCLMAQRKQMEKQVLPQLAEAAEKLLEARLDHEAWMSLANSAFRLALRAGRRAKAKAILAQDQFLAAARAKRRSRPGGFVNRSRRGWLLHDYRAVLRT